jgi:hypothetical protein
MRDFVVLLIVCLILLGGLFTKPLLYHQSPTTLYSEQVLSLIKKTTISSTSNKNISTEQAATSTTATSTLPQNKATD